MGNIFFSVSTRDMLININLWEIEKEKSVTTYLQVGGDASRSGTKYLKFAVIIVSVDYKEHISFNSKALSDVQAPKMQDCLRSRSSTLDGVQRGGFQVLGLNKSVDLRHLLVLKCTNKYLESKVSHTSIGHVEKASYIRLVISVASSSKLFSDFCRSAFNSTW
ncbi:hypothetical protein NPIL_459321 [Nephila pilipes]|uniref:Uncharacterized protein n=1 Tax=Nephila pilipes TaxID=299642 RepID=A0A8X6NF39_NEPPI|nr:hypothetical protein NPIL_459321 [Nephila pilipes]